MANSSLLDAKVKGNMIFSAHCQGDALQNLKPALSELIVNGEIRNQYELDQVIKWLNK
jgi:hypothetical protein